MMTWHTLFFSSYLFFHFFLLSSLSCACAATISLLILIPHRLSSPSSSTERRHLRAPPRPSSPLAATLSPPLSSSSPPPPLTSVGRPSSLLRPRAGSRVAGLPHPHLLLHLDPSPSRCRTTPPPPDAASPDELLLRARACELDASSVADSPQRSTAPSTSTPSHLPCTERTRAKRRHLLAQSRPPSTRVGAWLPLPRAPRR